MPKHSDRKCGALGGNCSPIASVARRPSATCWGVRPASAAAHVSPASPVGDSPYWLAQVWPNIAPMRAQKLSSACWERRGAARGFAMSAFDDVGLDAFDNARLACFTMTGSFGFRRVDVAPSVAGGRVENVGGIVAVLAQPLELGDDQRSGTGSQRM